MELGFLATGIGEDSRLLRREQEHLVLALDFFLGAQNPAGGIPTPPTPGIQTPTHLSTEGCHGNHTLGQAHGTPSPLAAGSPPVALPCPIPGHLRTEPGPYHLPPGRPCFCPLT